MSKPPVYRIKVGNRYKRDIRRLAKAGIDLYPLEHVIGLLSRGEKLPERYRDHELKQKLKGIRECHIGPDWLLLYVKDQDALILLLLRTGDHRETLGIE